MIEKILGIAILVVWFAIILGEGWTKKSNFAVNVVIGILEFLLIGCFYCVPFWLIFMR